MHCRLVGGLGKLGPVYSSNFAPGRNLPRGEFISACGGKAVSVYNSNHAEERVETSPRGEFALAF